MRRRLEQKRARYAANKDAIHAQRAAHRKANKEHFIAVGRANYENNRDSLLEKQRARRKANPERTKAHEKKANDRAKSLRAPDFNKNRYASNRELFVTRSRSYYANNTAKCRASMRASAKKHSAKRTAYRKAHPEYGRAAQQRRRAIKAGASIIEQEAITKWERAWRRKKRVRCNWCNKMFPPKKCHTDHVLSLIVSKEHSIRNVCISCADCNLMKNDKSIPEWNTHLEQPVLF